MPAEQRAGLATACVQLRSSGAPSPLSPLLCLRVQVMGAEAAAVRIQYVSGTHAISSALFGCLR